ncbi:kynurenine/alpha-aminoadipate aminotransferase, mitochondrial [Bicyclus anynana]|uniref:Kynurenine/alpha-aminoadipate aminotransferase, mitochondrial n=1 Tax=Bicyclus anynana TaxID=110368 RepID=A0A6J1NFK1_BICAN|nr:kynurenine/alpha-aminoadipate aminotransferase, mitochondrial [Bicyclus anynana]
MMVQPVAKMNPKLFKKLSGARALCALLKCRYSTSADDIFKFYPDEETKVNQKYRVLDEKDYSRFFSKRALRREPAFTRQITALAYKVGKDMISLAEGMPNEAIFPFTRLELTSRAGGKIIFDEKQLGTALQYLPSQGLPALLTELRSFQQALHRPPPLARDVLVTNGSQHGIYQCVELLLNHGDAIVTTEYSYSGVYSVLKPYQPDIIGIPEDEHGMIPETLESVLNERLVRGLKMPKVMYLIPTGNNPTGTVLPEGRRRKIYELACKYDFLILEDDPYMFLNYTDRVASFLSLDACGRVIRLDSLSKVVSSGMRAAWITAPAAFIQRAELHTQAEILHSCTLTQAISFHLITDRDALATHLLATRAFYEQRRNALSGALRGAGDLLQWSEPAGGLFHWVRVRGVRDVYNLVFHTAFDRGLMLVPGQAFQYDSSGPCQFLRLTFSKINEQDIEPTVRLLADIVRHEQQLAKRQRRLATEQ